MRRIVMRVAVLLLLGAVVNVAVAWACALWIPLPQVFTSTPIKCPENWPTYLRDSWPPPTRAEEIVGFQQGIGRLGMSVIEVTSAQVQASAENPITDATLTIHRFGVPVRSMQWEEHGLNAGEQSIALLVDAAGAAGWRTGIRTSLQGIPNLKSHRRHLPITTVWPGFAINTFFYAAILGLLFAAPGRVRRWWRIRRGLCAKCAYPIGASDVCTECGAALRARLKN